MKLVTFEGGCGRVEKDEIVVLGDDLVTVLEVGDTGGAGTSKVRLDSARLQAPVVRPSKVVCIGLNYRDHAQETNQELPEEPIIFPKFANSVVGPGAMIEVPPLAHKVDYEAELAVVIGRRARAVSADDALDYVAGYTCANDVSARDLQRGNGGQWMRGKAIDTFLPLGPWIVTADEIADPDNLAIRCTVNGNVMQDSNTNQMVFGCADLVSFISQTITLEPGDLIPTGTPGGVGFVRDPKFFLSDGDEVAVEIEGIGILTNTVRFAQ